MALSSTRKLRQIVASEVAAPIDWSNVAILGGSINNTIIGDVAPNTGAFTQVATPILSSGGNVSLSLQTNSVERIGIESNGNMDFGGLFAVKGSQSQVILADGIPLHLRSTGALQFGGPGNDAVDLILLRDAANTLALRNGVNAQTANFYGSYTDASNYMRWRIGTAAAYCSLTPEALGTGSLNGFIIGNQGIPGFFDSVGTTFRGGGIVFGTDNTYDIGASGATRPRSIYVGTQVNVGDNIQYGAGTRIYGSTDGSIELRNAAQSLGVHFGASAGGLVIGSGGSSASYPALKRSGTSLQTRLADDSAFAPIQGKITTDAAATTGLSAGVLAALTNASIVIYDSTGTAYRIPCVTP